MRALEARPPFGVDALSWVDRAEPVVGAGQVVLEMRAWSLNYRDLLVVGGFHRWRPPGPRLPISDGVGVVAAVGRGVSRVALGDRVAPIFYPRWLAGGPEPWKLDVSLGGAAADGVAAERVVVDAEAVVHVPAHLSDVEAATLPCAGVTAWNGVVEGGGVRAGETVLVLGTGGVALFALQLARLAGARVIVTSSSDAKLERARELGATAGVNYRTDPEWPRRVVELTGGGADLVVDTAGTLADAVAAVRVGGRISFVGLLVGSKAEIDLVALMGSSARLQAIDVGSRAMFEAMGRAIATAGMRPVVDRVFPFAEAAEALRHLDGRSHFGKVCLVRGD
jgi:NADPH:quinone reductase-like Zn-dependent oxidoreductase